MRARVVCALSTQCFSTGNPWKVGRARPARHGQACLDWRRLLVAGATVLGRGEWRARGAEESVRRRQRMFWGAALRKFSQTGAIAAGNTG